MRTRAPTWSPVPSLPWCWREAAEAVLMSGFEAMVYCVYGVAVLFAFGIIGGHALDILQEHFEDRRHGLNAVRHEVKRIADALEKKP